MRFRHRDGTVVHTAYCTNVHRAEDFDGIVAQLGAYAEPVRQRLDAARLGVGLWLPAPVVATLVERPELTVRLRSELDSRGLEVVTLNAFPYAGFGDSVVKKAVYLPDWTDPRRLQYTVDCARVLVSLLPDDVDRGSVSTLPVAWRTPWSQDDDTAARRNLATLGAALAGIADATGRTIRVGIEPEPGCLAETTAQAAALLDGQDPRHLGLCVDTCHLAVAFEDPATAIGALVDAGIPVVKSQVSAALHAQTPGDPAADERLRAYVEPRFLHQVKEFAGEVRGADDLDAALAGELDRSGPWRVHFHTPLDTDPPAPLASSLPVTLDALDAMVGGDRAVTDHLEVETYTWPVMADTAARVVDGIADELAFLRDALIKLGLDPKDR